MTRSLDSENCWRIMLTISLMASAVVSSPMEQSLEDNMQIHHIKPECSRVVSDHVVGLHDVKSGALLQMVHPWETKNPMIGLH